MPEAGHSSSLGHDSEGGSQVDKLPPFINEKKNIFRLKTNQLFTPNNVLYKTKYFFFFKFSIQNIN